MTASPFRRASSAILFCALALAAGRAGATTVTYGDFSSTAGLTLVGNTTTVTTADGTVLRLTGSAGNQAGAAYSTTAVTLGASDTFSTTFQFRFTTPAGADPADGITFVLSNSPSGLGAVGNGMGYAGVGNSMAVEFDTYGNGPGSLGPIAGGDAGNSSNHVAIDTNGVLTNTDFAYPYGVQFCDFTLAHPNTTSGCMSNGDLWRATIGYDGAHLSVTVQDGTNAPTTLISNAAIDIGTLLGSNTAYVGFTGSTGAGYENQDIVNWSFANTTELANIPEPASFAPLGFALLALAGLRHRRR